MTARILIFRGGWAGHDPVPTSELVAKTLRERGVEVDIQDTQACLLEPDLAERYQVIVPVWTMGEIGKAELQALIAAVQKGVAVGGWHGGAGDAFRQSTQYQFMIGGQWVAHPGGVIDYRVNIVQHDHPILKGLKDFDMHSEQYYMHVDPNSNVLATTTFDARHAEWIDGTVMPVVWTRRYGKGRVFYSSLGHVIADFERTPEVLEITVRGLMWAAGVL
ncbi:ThuA domain-containing protein [Oligosphaera ethanolica]|uniref:Type 1 glutamine amidotransferase n=1 Tax=Oligosphaera ethanolica TaxID=760260 RepID=A0AAE4AP31_9BACT|nr:ThuA domain-containing protein [Oligosphaera ethanolica]MDQ0289543.1 type 1 glutamine amidotransferase [Oligosphaera ethanolica]